MLHSPPTVGSTAGYRSFRLKDIDPDWYSKDYIFRGPIVGPINRADLDETNVAFGLDAAFPDLERHAFGHCVDPENPYRCLYFDSLCNYTRLINMLL